MSTNDFLPANYEAPKSGGRYMKLQSGENRFRILSKPLLGWEYWNTNEKPVRLLDKPKTLPADIRADKYGKKELRHFWAMTVFNYATNQIEILQINQASIQGDITALAKDSDWGNPFGYDIKISKTGQDKETRYAVNPVPHKPVSEEVKAAYKANPIDLNALLNGGDPFAGASQQNPNFQQPQQPAGTVTAQVGSTPTQKSAPASADKVEDLPQHEMAANELPF